ncbi:MAG: glutamate 5-kinase, partial [Deltaproteobacteria bacterium]|nr:glutamate 5-kinase [Deltaproteobacteria bacterium]
MNRNSIKKSKTWVIKIGSSILADALSGVNLRVFRSLSEQVMQLRKKGHSVILVSSGAIACGMHQLGFVKKPKEIEKKQAIAAVGQITLMNHYARAFSKHGLTIAQILLTRSDIEDRKRYLNARHAIRELLKQNIIPIINENDTVAVEEIKFGDNDNLSALVAKLVEADLLVILSDIEGVYTANPQTNPQAVLIPLILKLDQKIES